MAWKWFEKRRTQDRWEIIRHRGHLRHIALLLVIMLGYYTTIRLIHIALFRIGWVGSAGETTVADVFFYAIVPAIIAAELDWGDMKRRFSLKPGQDRTMV